MAKSVTSSFSKDLSHEAKAKDSTLKGKAKTKDFKIVLEDSNTGGWLVGRSVVPSYKGAQFHSLGLCTFQEVGNANSIICKHMIPRSVILAGY